MKSIPKVKPIKKASKPEPRPAAPGRTCPNCGEIREQPDPGDGGTYYGWEKWVDAPHENPFDCIRFLRKELSSVKDDISSIQRDISDIDAPRMDRC